MGMIAAAVQNLIKAGVTGDALVTAIADMEEAAKPVRSAGADRMVRYRLRKKEASQVTHVTHGDASPLPDKERVSPAPLPKEINHPRSYTREDGFDDFWSGWPHKVGKPAAFKAFLIARRSFSLEAIIAGRDRYIAARPPDRQWLNPATFLNQERFADEPAANPVPAKERPHDALFRALAEIAEGGTGLGGGEVGFDGAPATAGMADPLHRDPYSQPWRTSGPTRPRPRLIEGGRGGDRQADGGVSDASTVRYPDFPADAGIFRGSG